MMQSDHGGSVVLFPETALQPVKLGMVKDAMNLTLNQSIKSEYAQFTCLRYVVQCRSFAKGVVTSKGSAQPCTFVMVPGDNKDGHAQGRQNIPQKSIVRRRTAICQVARKYHRIKRRPVGGNICHDLACGLCRIRADQTRFGNIRKNVEI